MNWKPLSLLFSWLLISSLFSNLPAAFSTPESSLAWPTLAFTPVVSGLNLPVHLTNAGDSSGRIFAVEQGGKIRILQNNTLGGTFLDITDRVLSPASGGGNEQGLLSVAFPPDYITKGYFYVYYTNKSGNNQVSRFHITANPDLADPASDELILPLEHPTYTNHNGGQLFFGPDGYLYIGTGDGGGGGDPFGNGQNLSALLGKILRIDVEMTPSPLVDAPYHVYLPFLNNAVDSPVKYAIPSDNPFVDHPNARPEIWALGVRNPWRFSFDRLTGDLLIGDVGQNRIEEVDFQPASSAGGENYGWNILEGSLCYSPSTNCIPPLNYVPPAVEYEHGTNDSIGCSITGGYVYRGSNPALYGIYYFADYCTGRVWGMQMDNGNWVMQELANTSYWVSSFGEDQSGELYLIDRTGGAIYQLTTATH